MPGVLLAPSTARRAGHGRARRGRGGVRPAERARWREHAAGTIDHWEILERARRRVGVRRDRRRSTRAMLSAAYDGDQGAGARTRQVLLGGLMTPHEPEWLERVFATPGADAIHKFDIANVHLRGPVDAVVRRYGEFKAWLAAPRVHRPAVGDRARVRSRPRVPERPRLPRWRSRAGRLPDADAPRASVRRARREVFVTLHDGSLDGEYASEGLEHIDEPPGGGYPVAAPARIRRGAARVVDDWDQLIAWRAQQRDQEQEQRVEQGEERDCRGRSARGARSRCALR